ncbi:MAG: glycosyl hydrolase family 18 protein, partial [Clostridia bacterium]|nr:glycosyl hydrolase family 18 protein [Clostridia bacterium]
MKKAYIRKTLLAAMIFLLASAPPLRAQLQKINMTYLYAGNTSIYINNVDRADSEIQIVCPDYFELYSNGNLKILPKADTAFVDAMHNRNISVTPFLTNNWDRTLGRAALANRVSLAAQIVSAINQYGFDGINIDLENLTDVDRANYTDFVRLIRESLPSGKMISIAVAANPYGVYYGWAGSYDYAALGQLCDS